MCMNCGCNEPDERHGNDANITMEDLRSAARATGQDLDETVGNIERTYHASSEAAQAGQGHQHTF